MSGVVTMEDIVETLLGAEIVDETDGEVDMQAFARKNWRNRFKKAEVKRAVAHHPHEVPPATASSPSLTPAASSPESR